MWRRKRMPAKTQGRRMGYGQTRERQGMAKGSGAPRRARRRRGQSDHMRIRSTGPARWSMARDREARKTDRRDGWTDERRQQQRGAERSDGEEDGVPDLAGVGPGGGAGEGARNRARWR